MSNFKVYLPEEILEGIEKCDRNLLLRSEVLDFCKKNGFDKTADWIENTEDYYDGAKNGFGKLEDKDYSNINGDSRTPYYTKLSMLSYAKNLVNQCDNEDYKKIPCVCGKSSLCVRGHMGYTNYHISDRSNCPKICPFYK